MMYRAIKGIVVWNSSPICNVLVALLRIMQEARWATRLLFPYPTYILRLRAGAVF